MALTALIILLNLTGTPYTTYFDGAQFLHCLLGGTREVALSLASKSATIPIAMGIAEKISGLPAYPAAPV